MPDVFSDPPVLHTERLVLRQITESDGEGLLSIFADDQVTEFYAWDRFTDVGQGHELAARTAGQFRQREAIRWGLVLPGAPHIIGTCGYTGWSQENRFALLGYDLARDYWRRGLMSEAVAAVLRFGFEQMALHRVEATVLTGNTASAALLSRAGFQREGVSAEAACESMHKALPWKPPEGTSARPAADEDVARSGSTIASQSSGRSITGPRAHSFDHRGHEEDKRSCYGSQAHRYERGTRPGLDIRSGKWRRWIETERFRHVMPPENLEIDGVPAEYPDDSADPSQPSHRQVSGS
jgi:ribosomal-protein-alanine N-acetyltransferase